MKLKKILKKMSLLLIFVIPFLFVCIENKVPTNDMWFLLNLGRYVDNHGIPYVDPFTIHEGLNYVMQQWGSATIIWSFYDFLGKDGLLLLIYLMFFLLMFVFYKLCKLVSNKQNISILLTALAFLILSDYIVHRPQIFTYLILLLEILFLEFYVKKKNYKYLIPLPFLSLLLINLHMSMWYFQFIFMLPFIVNSFKIKNVSLEKYDLKPLIVISVLMFLCGLINPYGIDAITFVFKSYGLSLINENINEMIAPSLGNIHSLYMIISIICLGCLIIFILYCKNFKLDLRHLCFVGGTYILFLMHAKCFPFFIFAVIYSFAYGIKKFKKIKIKNVVCMNILNIGKCFYYAISLMLFFTFFFLIYNMHEYYFFHPSVMFDKDSEIIADYIIDNYNKEEVRLYINYDNGGYYQFRGIKTYIDPRAELFFKSNNLKEDIFVEAVEIFEDVNFDYEKFVNKYSFTHLVVEASSLFNKYLENDERYELVFTSFHNQGNNRLKYQNLYSLKEKN